MNPQKAALKVIRDTGQAEGLNPRTVAALERRGNIRRTGTGWELTRRGESRLAGKLGNTANLARKWDEMAKDPKRATARHKGGGKIARSRSQQAADRREHEAELAAHGRSLAKAQAAEDQAEARILGPSGATRALKIAKPHGTFTPEDVRELAAAGWEVHPAGTVSAKTGLTLGAITPFDLALNPTPDLARVLGPQREARAVVLAHPEPVITSDTLHSFRRAGFDVAAAPKRLREPRKASNPAGPEQKVYQALVKAAKRGETPTADDLAELLKEPEERIGQRLSSLARQGLAHAVPGGLFGAGWAPGAVQPGLAFNPGGQKGAGAATAPKRGKEPGSMAKPKAKKPQTLTKSGRGAAAGKAKPARGTASKAAPRPDTPKVQPLRSKGADRHRAVKVLEEVLKPAPRRRKAAEPKAKVESATVKVTFNPSTEGDVERVWKLWTGARPGQVLKVKVADPTGQLPVHVALLGRVSRFIQADGSLMDFGSSGPLLVTDGEASKVWLIHPKTQRFDVRPRIICYLARKPKFGDRGLVEYIHAFESSARARMDGQVGELTGGFRLTPRGIEG